jgi:hypothetical protein
MPDQDAPPEKFMKCRNGSCESITVTEVPYVQGTRMYKCTKCSHMTPVQLGGQMDINQL